MIYLVVPLCVGAVSKPYNNQTMAISIVYVHHTTRGSQLGLHNYKKNYSDILRGFRTNREKLQKSEIIEFACGFLLKLCFL